jgi:signal transduction histidine kinase
MKSLLLSAFLVLQFSLFATKTLTVDSLKQEVNLKNYCFHFEDTTDILSIDKINTVTWEKLNGPTSFPVNKHPQWLKYNLKNTYDKPIQKTIFIPYHLINKVEVYTLVDSIYSSLSQTGIHNSYSAKYIRSMGYPIKIVLKQKSTTAILIRLDYLYRPLRATTYLMSENRVRKVIEKSNTIIWLWRGVFLFAIFISLVFYWFVRLKLFLYYSLLNLGVAFFIGSQIGDYFMFFDTDPTNITSVIDFTGTILINLFLPQFLNALTPIKENNKTLWKWMYRFIYGGVIILLLNLFPQIRNSSLMFYSHFYIMILTVIVFMMQLGFLLKNSFLKIKNSILTFIIYGIYIFTAFSEAILPNFGLIEDSPFIFKILLYSSFFEMFSFMLLMGKETVTIYKDRSALLYQQKQHQKEIIFSMVSGQEEERNRVGRELHDLIGANMAIIKQKIDKKNADLYKVVEQTITDVRVLSHGLVTNMEKDDDFMDEIKEMGHLFNADKKECHTYFYNWPTINDTDLTTHLYRITQELLQNANKHSQANSVHLQFIGDNENKISLIYEDDGVGFNSRQKYKGLGLKNIKNRVQLINGTLQVDAQPNGKGTTVIIEVVLADN